MSMGGMGGVGALGGGFAAIAPIGIQGISNTNFGSSISNVQNLGVTVTISQAARQALAADPLNLQGSSMLDMLNSVAQSSAANSTQKVAQSDTLLALEVLLALLGNSDSTSSSNQTTLANAASAIEAYKAMAALGAAI